MSGAVNDPASAAAKATGGIPEQVADVDCSKLNALSPEVIARQATVSCALPVRGIANRLDQHRYHWSCRTRKVVHCPSRFWSHYYSIQERVGTKYYHQTWLRKCQGQSFYFDQGSNTDGDRSTSARTPNAPLHPTTDHTLPVPRFTHLVSDPVVEGLWTSSGESCESWVWAELMLDTSLSSIVQVTIFSWLPC
jgi:hypothetical protein